MPKKKISSKRKARNSDRLNSTQRFFLKSGVVLSGLKNELGFDRYDMKSISALWKVHKKELLSGINDRLNPGWRPWAFWQFDTDITFREEIAKSRCGYYDRWKKIEYLSNNNLLLQWEHDSLESLVLNGSMQYCPVVKALHYGPGKECCSVHCNMKSNGLGVKENVRI